MYINQKLEITYQYARIAYVKGCYCPINETVDNWDSHNCL